MEAFGLKYPSEKWVLFFDFTDALSANGVLTNLLTGVISVTVTVKCGTDASPTAVLNGAASLNTAPYTKQNGVVVQPNCGVLQPVHGGQSDVSYIIEPSCTTQDPNVVLSCPGLLPVGFP